MPLRNDDTSRRFLGLNAAELVVVISFSLGGLWAFEDAKSDIRDTRTTVEMLHARGDEKRADIQKQIADQNEAMKEKLEEKQRQLTAEQVQLDSLRGVYNETHDAIIEIKTDMNQIRKELDNRLPPPPLRQR